jgi:CRP/FNR family transcriptional regulator
MTQSPISLDNPRRAHDPTADGDEHKFCTTCAFAGVCLPGGYEKTLLAELQCLIDHTDPIAPGQHVFRVNDPFLAVYAVRAGIVKTYVVDDEGREQVLGFFLPGELVGLDAIHPAHHPCNAMALDTVTLCRFSFPAIASLSTRMPDLQAQLFRLLSKDIAASSLLSGDFSADERLAAFLVSLSDRLVKRGYSAIRLNLVMSRADIANYLRLATETVSRVLRRFQDDGLIEVERREVAIRDLPRLKHLARCVLRT